MHINKLKRFFFKSLKLHIIYTKIITKHLSMRSICRLIIITFISMNFHFSYSQVYYPKKIDENKIVSELFDAKWFEKDSTNRWIPSISESIKFDVTQKDTLRTKIDTVFNYKQDNIDYKIILTKTYKFNDVCHACQPVLGIIELRSIETKDTIFVTNMNKFVTRFGTWGEAPKKRSLMQLNEDLYCVKITEYSSGMGMEVGLTSIYYNCNKIFSIKSYESNFDAVEFEYQKYRYSSKIYFDKKSKTIKIIKKGSKPNKMNRIEKINTIDTYKFSGEFLEKI